MTPVSIAHLGEVPLGVQFHPNGQFVVVATQRGLDVRVAASGEKAWGARLPVDGLALFAEGGRSVLTVEGAGDEELRLVRVTESDREPLGPVIRLLGVSPDGTKALLYGDRLSLAIVELETLHIDPFGAAKTNPPSGAISNDGRRVLLRDPLAITGMTVPQTETWVLRVDGHGPFALHPLGTHFLHRANDATRVLVNEWERRASRPSPLSTTGLVHDIGFSSDGGLLHVSGESGSSLWNANGAPLCHLAHTGFGNARSSVFCAAFSRDGKRFATVTAGGDLFVWDLPG